MKTALLAIFAFALGLVGSPADAALEIGTTAPDFSVMDSNGKTQSLAAYKGKTVVLEWNNPECPFVKKHYGAGNMQKQQAAATANGVVWLTVNSGAVGNQGHKDGAGANAFVASSNAKPTAYLMDADGKVGKLYGARTTPHLFVIDGGGILRYMGGIDSVSSADPSDIDDATQYVSQALAELAAGKIVSVPHAPPYGCSVKYGS